MFFYICIPNITFNVPVINSPVFLRFLANGLQVAKVIYGTIFVNVYLWKDKYAQGLKIHVITN